MGHGLVVISKWKMDYDYKKKKKVIRKNKKGAYANELRRGMEI